MSSCTFGTSTALPFEAAVDRVASELVKEGFGVLSEIDAAVKVIDATSIHSALI